MLALCWAFKMLYNNFFLVCFLLKKKKRAETVLYFPSFTLFTHYNIVSNIRISCLHLLIRFFNEIKHVSSLIRLFFISISHNFFMISVLEALIEPYQDLSISISQPDFWFFIALKKNKKKQRTFADIKLVWLLLNTSSCFVDVVLVEWLETLFVCNILLIMIISWRYREDFGKRYFVRTTLDFVPFIFWRISWVLLTFVIMHYSRSCVLLPSSLF